MDNDNLDISMGGYDPVNIPGSRRVADRRSDARTADTGRRTSGQKASDKRRNQTAPRREPAPARRKSGKPALLRFFADKRTRAALGVVLVVTSLLMLAATVSHMRNGAADQSAIESMSVGQMAASGVAVGNAAGPAGATLSQWLFADGLGVGSFVLVVWIAMLGLSLLRIIKVHFWSLTAKCLFSAISLSIVTGLITYGADSYVHWGGAHGRQANEWLMGVGHVLLAIAVSVALTGILICIYLNELATAWNTVSNTVGRRREAWRAARSEERTRKATRLADPDDDEAAAAPAARRDAAARDITHSAEAAAETTTDDSYDALRDMPPARSMTDNGFDIDADDDPADSEYAPRRRPADEAAPEPEPDSHAPAYAADAEADVPAESEIPETEFVVHTAEADNESFAIDEDEAEHDGEDTPRHSDAVQAVLDSEPYDPRAELSHYRFPDVELLISRDSAPVVDMEEQRANKELIVKTLSDYRIPIERIEATVGPTVTLYEVRPAEGVRIAQIKRLEDDIALSLSALGIRIIAPIPGKDVVGLEVPNRDKQIVSIRNVLGSRKFRECDMKLPMAMGATISNDIFIADLAKIPHLLVAGATGQGKSVGLNCILASLLYKKHPSELKLVLIDPKMVEFSLYSKLERHYLAKLPDEEEAIVTDPQKAAATLHSLCIEMDNRYQLLRLAQVRNLEEYNEKFQARRLNPELGHRYMPYIVMVVDEFADLIMQAGKEVSLSIARIAQKARAVGMHMIIATQRPSTDVISGMIKNNFPGRIAFKVSQMVDSRTILDSPGANRLIGRGDMLFSHNSEMTRVQCALIETSEVEAIVDHINDQIGYTQPYLLPEIPAEAGGAGDAGGMVDLSKRDAMFDQCARFIVTQSTASTSMLQRRFGIGYNKAGKIMDQMEAAGIVGPACGAKPRSILVDSISLESILAEG